MAFHMGSLGFLTPFEIDNFEEQVTNVLEGIRFLIARSFSPTSAQEFSHYSALLLALKFLGYMRRFFFNCIGHAALTLRSRLRCIILRKDETKNKTNKPTSYLVLNEVVIDRGPSPYLSNIDLYLDGKHITSVQGDGNLLRFFKLSIAALWH